MTFHTRSLVTKPTTVDMEARTVEAIVSTGADVPRGGFIERLDLRGADLSRLIGAPFLDAHRTASTRDQLGVVEAAERRPEGLWVRLRLRDNDAARAVLRDVQDGTLRGLSIGYSIQDAREERDGQRRVRLVTQWTPIEVSAVPVPADPGAHFRAGEIEMTHRPNIDAVRERLEFIERDGFIEMRLRGEDDDADDGGQDTTRGQIDTQIRNMVADMGLPNTYAEALIVKDATIEEARSAMISAKRHHEKSTRTRSTRAQIGTDHTDPGVVSQRAGEALYARTHPEHSLSPEARQWAGMTMPDLARDALQRAGVSTAGLYGEPLITRALHTTSDFPLILGDAVGRELRRTYSAPASGIRQVARQTSVRDFRAKRSITMGSAPGLLKVLEAGEFEYGTIDESAEAYRVETFGRIVAVSRQAIVNDDLGAFTRVPAMMGTAARTFEDKTLAAIVEANPTLSDSVAVFDVAHLNVDGSGSLGESALAAARLAMRKQKGLGGELINVTPRYLLVPADLETAAEKLLTAVQAAKTDDVNPFSGLTLIVEPRLTNTTRFYVVADPAQIDGLEYAYLEGAPGPQIESRAGFEVDGVQIKVRLDFGAGWIDHRGWYRVGA